MATIRPIVQQFLKGSWTNDPGDDNYANHWNCVGELAPGERVEAVYPAQLQASQSLGPLRPTNSVNVVVTDRQIRVDTPAIERFGSVASLAGRSLDQMGLSQPLSYSRDQVQIQEVPGRPRVEIGLPDGRTMVGKTDLHIGRSKDMSAGEQLRNLGRMLRR